MSLLAALKLSTVKAFGRLDSFLKAIIFSQQNRTLSVTKPYNFVRENNAELNASEGFKAGIAVVGRMPRILRNKEFEKLLVLFFTKFN